MILEAIVSTMNDDGEPHLAPMGPWVDEELTQFTLKPFRTSQTCKNLLLHAEGVIHVTDDVLLLAQALVGTWNERSSLAPTTKVRGMRLKDCCRFWEFRVMQLMEDPQRLEFRLEIVHQETVRDFWGFNRAKHAVLEAAILASRIHILDTNHVHEELRKLRVLVTKTGGEREHRAMDLLEKHVSSASCKPRESP